MDWNAIWQDVISSTISGVLVIIFGGIIAWFAYITGIKGKEKDQKASERKNEIYIPLKYELKSLIRAPSDIWKELKVTEIEKIVEKNDELVVSDYLWKQCEMLLQLINSYNSIDLYNVVGKILCTQFEKKYIELYGSLTHPMTHWDEISGEEFEYEEYDQEFMDFTSVAYDKKNVDTIFKTDPGCEEYYRELGQIAPTEEFIARMFAMVLPKKEQRYARINLKNIDCKLLREKKISPAEYMVRDFDFYEKFKNDKKVEDKQEMLDKIKELSFQIYEDVVQKIRSIGKKYEAE